MPNSRVASGEASASSSLVASNVPSGSTTRPGRNFRVAGFGVASVWMNIGYLSAAVRPGRMALLRDLSALSPECGPWPRESKPVRLPGERVDLVVGEIARHDHDRHREGARRHGGGRRDE